MNFKLTKNMSATSQLSAWQLSNCIHLERIAVSSFDNHNIVGNGDCPQDSITPSSFKNLRIPFTFLASFCPSLCIFWEVIHVFLLGTFLIFPGFRFFFFFYGSLWLVICSCGVHSDAWIPEHHWLYQGDGRITKTMTSLESEQFWLNQRPMTCSLENHHSLFGSKNEWWLPAFLFTTLQVFRQGFEHINQYINASVVWWYIKKGKSSKWVFHHTPEDHPILSLPWYYHFRSLQLLQYLTCKLIVLI